MINPPLGQPVRNYSKRGCFNSRGCRGAHANVGAIFGEKEASLQDKDNDRAQVYAAIEHEGNNCQFSLIQAPTSYEGKSFKLLIDFGNSHSFLSPKCIHNLSLKLQPSKKLTIELASGKEVVTCFAIGKLDFL